MSNPLQATAQATILRHNMLPADSRVIVAVSGGSDSVCLLHVLRESGCQLTGVAHFNHKLRGEESDQDEQFVADLARSLSLPFHTASASIGELPGNLEQNARHARREFFRSLINGSHATRIALGHTRDDQAETVLFRLLRGTGLSGLVGILPVTEEGLIRPLLDVRRGDILTYLRENGLVWREDSSNQSPDFARNRIRHSLLPQLVKEWNPQISDALAHLADTAYQEEAWWTAEISRLAPSLLRRGNGIVELCVKSLTSLEPAMQRRVIRHAIKLAKCDLTGVNFAHIEAIAALATSERGAGRLTLPDVDVIRSFEWLLLAKRIAACSKSGAIHVTTPGEYGWPTSNPLIKLVISCNASGFGPCDTLGIPSLDLELRGWRAGDRYQPVGRLREMKIKELFQQARIPSWRRSCWPILTSSGKILWAKEFGPAIGSPVLQVREIPLDV